MVLILNILVAVIAILTGYFLARGIVGGERRSLILGLLLIPVAWLIILASPSYLPKGTVTKVAPAPLEVTTEAVIEDRLRKPSLTEDERTEHLDKKLDAVEQSKQ